MSLISYLPYLNKKLPLLTTLKLLSCQLIRGKGGQQCDVLLTYLDTGDKTGDAEGGTAGFADWNYGVNSLVRLNL